MKFIISKVRVLILICFPAMIYGQYNIGLDTLYWNQANTGILCESTVSATFRGKFQYTGTSMPPENFYPLCIRKSSITLSLDGGSKFQNTQVTGPLAGYFTWTFTDANHNVIFGSQIQAIPLSAGLASGLFTVSIIAPSNNNQLFNYQVQVQGGAGAGACASGMNSIATDDVKKISATTAATCALPVHLVSFEAFKSGFKCFLNWSSTNEFNFSHYEIERSNDGITFQSLGLVFSNREQSKYVFIDSNPNFDLQYYRLKMVDLDGSYVYSDVKVVDFSSERSKQLNVYPNPFSQVFTIENLQTPSDITIFDITGKLIHKMSVTESNVLMDLSQHPSGIYSVLIKDKLDTKVFRVIKSE